MHKEAVEQAARAAAGRGGVLGRGQGHAAVHRSGTFEAARPAHPRGTSLAADQAREGVGGGLQRQLGVRLRRQGRAQQGLQVPRVSVRRLRAEHRRAAAHRLHQALQALQERPAEEEEPGAGHAHPQARAGHQRL